jgi:asparagine synthase (glutamine-hydrolysing)
MCGIAGILNRGHHHLQENPIRSMTNQIAHRGPDAEGVYVDENIALGHRRLSIIDLSEAANQPMFDHTGRYVIIFNGEIYNYNEVKASITDYPYRTQSDSEVILAAYDKWGSACLKKLNGMFALAIWDKQAKELFIARDRLGKKPLYYYSSNDFFVFGSEIRSLLSSSLVPRKLEENYLPEYLMYQAPMGAHTLVKNVSELKAGHFAMIKNGSMKEESFWSYEESQPTIDSYDTAKNKIRELFLDSVRLRMISDVPIGAFLSGGIDSSLVVACMAELSDQPINTYTISFDEKEFDESAYAQQIATKYKTSHHRILINPNEFLYSLDEILSAMDSPSGDGPNTYLVSKHTKQGAIKVALSGLGGDELFAGYNKFMLYRKIMKNRWLLQIPGVIRKQLPGTIQRVFNKNKSAKLIDLLALKKWDLSTVYPQLRKSFRRNDVNDLLKTPVREDFVVTHLSALNKATCWMGSLSKSTIGELETYTRDVLLRDTDQMAMAHALEVRVPFFDYRLVEYVLSLPDEYKYPHTPKKLLVDALAPRLPVEISGRKKMGFTFPMQKWLRNELADMADLKIKFLAGRSEFNGDALLQKYNHFQKGDPQVLWSQIWQLVVLSDWLQRNEL